MGFFKDLKINQIVNKANADLTRKASSQGGRCSNCRYYDSSRGVCVGPVNAFGQRLSGHITSPGSVCAHWEI
ncbi:MAG: hypothetical protein IKP42_10950 [Ruminococcus sp.]|nr:hypothetical protein [Ruminococcus sp.]